MLTVLIEAGDDAPALGASLSSLVSGAVEGLVREVVVLDAGLDVQVRKVADHAGCRVVPTGELAVVVGGAKGDWLLLLECGARLSSDWIESVYRHAGEVQGGTRTPRAARFSPRAGDQLGLFTRLRRRRTALADGLILPKAQAVGLARSATSVEAMARGLATTRLDATIRPAPQQR